MPRTIILAVSLPAPPGRLYEMYVDPALHAAFTGAAVTIEPRPGAEFRAFNGAVWGSILHVEPKRLIVQRWRSVNFPEEAIDSTLTLSFWSEGAASNWCTQTCRKQDFAGVSEGWSKFYWNPWRAYLERNS
jgi:uncharacterized protein YndB with AHSA1/START domain